MKIDNINSTNFSALYRLKQPPKDIREISERVIPMYKYLRKRPATFFEANPLCSLLNEKFKEIAQGLKYSVEWLRSNAERHNLNLSYLDNNSILVVTQAEDINNLLDGVNKLRRQDNGFIGKITNFIENNKRSKQIAQYCRKFPPHLEELAICDYLYRENMKPFEDCLNGFKIIDVDSPQELLQKMLTEK